MAQLAVGVVGAAVGFYFGGPAGAQWGWAIGSAIGAVAFAPDGPQTQGPRLSDLSSNVSTYGQPLGRAYGQIGFMGSLIDMENMKEYANVEEQGKGGDPASATTFTYSDTFAIILCRGEDAEVPNSVPAKALLRMWINEKAYYDVRDETNVEAIIASNNFAQYFTFYPGSQTQMPDPTLEALHGVGNVPAYRGRVYIVFKDLPLAFWQNQPPGALRITCEVVMTGSPATGLRQLTFEGPGIAGGSGTYSMIMPVVDNVVRIMHQGNDYINLNTVKGETIGVIALSEEELEDWPSLSLLGDGTVAITPLIGGANMRAKGLGSVVQLNHASMRLYALDQEGGTIDALPLILPVTHYLHAVVPSSDQEHVLIVTGAAFGAADAWHMLQWQLSSEWLLIDTGTVSGAAISNAAGPTGAGFQWAAMMESDLRHIWWTSTSGVPGIYLNWIDDAGDLDLLDSIGYPTVNPSISFATTQLWTDDGLAYVMARDYWFIFTRNDGAAVNNQTLEDVFEAECSLAGLEPARVNASALAPIPIDGMFVRRVGATRGVLQALEPAYFFDTVEAANAGSTSMQLKAVRRGGASIVTITDDDLGASVSGQPDEDLVKPERADEASLPGEAFVNYIDRASDYQMSSQQDRRSAVATEQPATLEMPVVLTPDQARQIASVWIYNAWAGRTMRTVRLSRKYSYIEPTDVFTVSTDIADFTLRALSVKTNDGFIEIEAVDEDAALYTQNAEGAPVEQGSEIVISTPSKLVLMDIPMLRESDDDPGFYVAAAGYASTGWPGAVVMRSIDGGVTYTTSAIFTTPTVMGNVSAALGNFTGPMGYDSTNSITVTLFGDDTLQSCTDAELLAGANAFALGSPTTGYELGQFKTATLVSGRTWTVKQLLRGRRGSEHEMAGHGTFETFVLLEASKLRRIGISDPAIGVENHYKAVTIGQLASNAATVTLTNTAASLKPYSPVDAESTGFGGDITITWTRRGRIYNGWRDGIDLPLGEATESYSIDIYSGATLKRTLTSTTPTVIYTSAQQTTDFGAPIAAGVATAYIYQISVIVGRGFPLIATLS